jgi:hypothetical protein
MNRLSAAVTLLIAGIALPAARSSSRSPKPLVVHEWGTVTTRIGPNGLPAGKLNLLSTYDPLPSFVHEFEPAGVAGHPIRPLTKVDVGDGRPDITMRLETPVIYFHPEAGESVPPFDVSVDFRGGILNEFYPNAAASSNGWNGEHLSDSVVGSLRWHGVTLRDGVAVPNTANHVWLAPRQARSRPLTVGGESEQYLFYRGMANVDAPIRAQLVGGEVRVRGARPAGWFASPSLALGRVWLVDVGPRGEIAFRESDPLTLTRGDSSSVLARLAGFRSADYSVNGLDRLRGSMQRALVGAGLYDDEAHAMLATWKRSYFIEPGLRLFYIVPNEWVSYHLPLRISVPNTLTRVIVGRVDLPAFP